MRKRIGYFSGSDPQLLTELVCEGYDTIPVSNGRDSHGRHVRLINDQERYDLVIAPLHKIFAPEVRDPDDLTYQDIFHVCRTYEIPLLIGVPPRLHEKARALLGDPPPMVRLVDGAAMLETALDLLEHQG
ncbi:MAG: hypothetical protein ACR2PK_00340 [Acidimicrobiales bacterium]